MSEGALIVAPNLTIPRHELTFRASRAGGPGGQHVNTSSTRVEVLWNVATSRVIDENQRQRIQEKLASRIDAEGNVRVVGSAFRSQARNRNDAEARLASLVRRALMVPKARKKTRPSRTAVENRLRTKKLASAKKRERRRPHDDL
ncbi:MAG: alternative ribosome rescue aminoacyl-tRNA hydrolase ArfB [Gemmatimonadaceae bacterium]